MTCRSCRSDTEAVFSLGKQAPANALVAEADLGKPEPVQDVTVMLCPHCGLAQLREPAEPVRTFTTYPYRTGHSPSLRKHLAALAEKYGGPGRMVIEVGSNDGTLLGYFQRTGAEVLGFDPAANLAAVANAEGLRTRCEFFGAETAVDRPADVIVARNVFAHIPDSHAFLEACLISMVPHGRIVIESPWVASMFEHADFGNVYSEHGIYLGVGSLRPLLRDHGLCIAAAEFTPIHGGSLVYELKMGVKDSEDALRFESREFLAGCYNEAGWKAFGQAAVRKRDFVTAMLLDCELAGRKIAGYCASAKGNVLLQWAGIGPRLLPYIADTTPAKIGLYTPVTHIPIVHPERLFKDEPECLLILSPNWMDDIAADPTLKRFGLVTPEGKTRDPVEVPR